MLGPYVDFFKLCLINCCSHSYLLALLLVEGILDVHMKLMESGADCR